MKRRASFADANRRWVMKSKIDLMLGEFEPKIASLIECCIDCHQQAALKNPNASSAAYQNALMGSGNVENGIASAILTLGKNHGPISEARVVFVEWSRHEFGIVNDGYKVPGFGNSFFRGRIDPSFEPLDTLLRCDFSHLSNRIDELTKWMQAYKPLYPNAAMYTAAVCHAAKIKPGLESALFIMARIPAWINL